MPTLQERIPRERFETVFRPMIRHFSTRMVILRLNEAAKIAIPRQTTLDGLMQKLVVLCYDQNRPRVVAELEQLWNLSFENRLAEHLEKFVELTDELNKHLDGEKLPVDQQQRAATTKATGAIVSFLRDNGFSYEEIDTAFRLRAYPEVLELFLADFKAE